MFWPITFCFHFKFYQWLSFSCSRFLCLLWIPIPCLGSLLSIWISNNLRAMFVWLYLHYCWVTSYFCFPFLFRVPRYRVLYLGAASMSTMSHVSDVVGPISSFIATYWRSSLWSWYKYFLSCKVIYMPHHFFFCRLELFMRLNFHIEVAWTLWAWQRSERMLFL